MDKAELCWYDAFVALETLFFLLATPTSMHTGSWFTFHVITFVQT